MINYFWIALVRPGIQRLLDGQFLIKLCIFLNIEMNFNVYHDQAI